MRLVNSAIAAPRGLTRCWAAPACAQRTPATSTPARRSRPPRLLSRPLATNSYHHHEQRLRTPPHNRRSAPEPPLRDELLSIERLEERAKALAARFTVAPTTRRAKHSIFPRFADNARLLRET